MELLIALALGDDQKGIEVIGREVGHQRLAVGEDAVAMHEDHSAGGGHRAAPTVDGRCDDRIGQDRLGRE